VLVDCDAALANCNAIDPADGLAWTPYQPALDAAHHALYMLGVDSIFGTFALERCDASGTPCAQIALPPGIAGNNAYVIDESAGRLTMPYLDTATNKLAAFNLRSW
jgi:hypothetical protein